MGVKVRNKRECGLVSVHKRGGGESWIRRSIEDKTFHDFIMPPTHVEVWNNVLHQKFQTF